MTPNIHNTIRIARSLGVLLTLLVMFTISSTQVVVEECSQETVSQEIELVLARRAVQRVDNPQNSDDPQFRLNRPVTVSNQSPSRFFVALTERANLNGAGAYLLI